MMCNWIGAESPAVYGAQEERPNQQIINAGNEMKAAAKELEFERAPALRNRKFEH